MNIDDKPDDEHEQALAEALATALVERGLQAEAWQSGGGIFVVLVSTDSGSVRCWGTASGAWGSYEIDEQEDAVPGSTVMTEIEPTDIETAADFITNLSEADLK